MDELIAMCKKQIDAAVARQWTCIQKQSNLPSGATSLYWQSEQLNALNEQLKWEHTLKALEDRNANFLTRTHGDFECGETGPETAQQTDR